MFCTVSLIHVRIECLLFSVRSSCENGVIVKALSVLCPAKSICSIRNMWHKWLMTGTHDSMIF